MSLPGVQFLSLPFALWGQATTLHPVLLCDAEEAVLVDAGPPGQCAALLEELAPHLTRKRLTAIVLTCQDVDHVGCAKELRETLGARLAAHREDVPYIEGERRPVKLDPGWARAKIAPFRREAGRVAEEIATDPERGSRFREDLVAAGRILAALPRVQVDDVLQGGETLPVLGGVDVLWTPGPTPGHVALYVRSLRLLLAGDLVRVEGGRLNRPKGVHLWDEAQALASLREVADRDVDYIVAYHGGLYGPEAGARLRELGATAGE